jgi:crotonobetainyl-CoA:carnitine CoA-transferase CaiB-like acyl-CoA transferase
VEFASNVAGPFAAVVLQDLGASVIKLERPCTGDDVRGWPPFDETRTSAPFTAINRGKESVEIDIKTPEGLALVLELLGHSDVFVTSLRPGKTDKLGLDAATLSRSHPHLVVCEISGYGPMGPLAREPGYDAILQAYTGIMDITGYPDGPPARVGTAMLDFGTGMWAAMGTAATLFRRLQNGVGGAVHASLLGTATGFLMHHIASMTMAGTQPRRIGTAQHNSAPYEALTAADGRVMVGVTSSALWLSLCEQLNCGELADDPLFATNEARVANRSLLVELLSNSIAERTAASVVAQLRAAGVPASEIRPVTALLDDEQLTAVGLIQDSAAEARLVASPVLFDGEIADLTEQRAPLLGEHTAAVLRRLGKSAAEIAWLREVGAIGRAEADT